MKNLAFVIGLALAGIDPVGMILLMTMQAMGLSPKKVYLFGGLILFGTALLGFILSLILGNEISNLAQALGQLPDRVWVWIYLVLIAVLMTWGVKRLLAVEDLDSQNSQKNSKGIYAAAVFMIYTAIVDPTFLAVLALSGQVNNTFLSLLYNLLWVLISQSPLFLLILAVMCNKHHVFISKFNAFYKRYRQPIRYGVTGIIFLSAIILIVDLSSYCFLDSWILG